jgi:putative ABC transport system ATP-binding protein
MTECGGSQPLAQRSPAVQVDAISRRDPQTGMWLIEGVSLTLDFGERLGVIGPSGAGKTVLLRALAMLDPIDAGEVRWQGTAVGADGVPRYRSRVVYLHQRPALADGSVLENLRLPFALAVHRDKAYNSQRAVELIEVVGRDASFLQKASRDLSGGEAQIVALVRALQFDPAVLLLDEPTASLDPATAHSVEIFLNRWLRESTEQRALVWVSHDHDQTLRMTDRRIHLRSGRLVPEN